MEKKGRLLEKKLHGKGRAVLGLGLLDSVIFVLVGEFRGCACNLDLFGPHFSSAKKVRYCGVVGCRVYIFFSLVLCYLGVCV